MFSCHLFLLFIDLSFLKYTIIVIKATIERVERYIKRIWQIDNFMYNDNYKNKNKQILMKKTIFSMLAAIIISAGVFSISNIVFLYADSSSYEKHEARALVARPMCLDLSDCTKIPSSTAQDSIDCAQMVSVMYPEHKTNISVECSDDIRNRWTDEYYR